MYSSAVKLLEDKHVDLTQVEQGMARVSEHGAT